VTRRPITRVVDEPESGLSFGSCPTFATMLIDALAGGSQVLLATHSPILVGLPGATLIELDDHGLRAVGFDDLELVTAHRLFLVDPHRYYRRLLSD
jgi:predicted ATPase